MNFYRNSVLLLIILSLGLCGSGVLAWQTNGVPICTAANEQLYPELVSDGSGGTIIIWLDGRTGSGYDIYAQRVNSTGSTLWTTNGVLIYSALLYPDNPPTIASDGSGGAIITWEDGDVFTQRVNSTGSTLWASNGVVVCDLESGQEMSALVSDGSGGAIITWVDDRNEPDWDIYAQRVDSTGSTLWTTDGVAICTVGNDEYSPSIVTDGLGGAIITWPGFIQRVNSMGSTLWTANGVPINSDDGQTMVSDGLGGAIITWGFGDIYAQRVNSTGSTLWTTAGVPICTATNVQESPTMASDGFGGAIITWEDYRNGDDWNVYAQRVNSIGSTLWILNGVAICTAPNDQTSPTIASDGFGGAIITWEDLSNGSVYNVYAQRVNSTGSTLWTLNGEAVCPTAYLQRYPTIVSDELGGAIITWQDARNGEYDIYAQEVDANGSIVPYVIAGFYAIPTVGEGPLTVNFVDISMNDPTSWSWDFGDGGTSDIQNPTHVYASVSGTTSYTVQLIAGNSLGVSTATYINYITINPLSQPNYANGLPSLKLFSNQSVNNVLFLEQYNTGDPANSYYAFNNFGGLVSLNESTVSQGAYGSATVGTNTFIMSNSVGASTVNNEVKYSTYKIYKLPHVGVTVGSSYDLNLANYTYNMSGQALPPSFGSMDALSTDNAAITAAWLDNSTIQITSVTTFSGTANVLVTASPNATAPFGSDVDVERIQVYSNLLLNGTFNTANDTIAWSPMEIPPGRTTMATQQWIPGYTDSAGTQANGVWQFTFADANGGVKATPEISNWITIINGQWYIFRIRLVADSTNNSHQSLLFGYTNYPGAGTQTDIVGNVLFGIPTVWTWQEAPLLAHGSSILGYPQFQFKAGGAGSIYIDEIQIINATPTLLEARSNTHSHYLYGQFTTGNDTTGWGQQLYFGSGSAPEISVNNGLVLNFAGATSGSGQLGIKWTANNGVQGPDHAYSFPVNPNYDVNVGLTLSVPPGSFNSLGIILAAAYGVQTSGQQDIGTPPSSLNAIAGVGILNSGTYYAEGDAVNPYYQGQFGVRSDVSGILVVSNVDVNVDNDDPNFGDPTLFP
jgi:PKD repeat protein